MRRLVNSFDKLILSAAKVQIKIKEKVKPSYFFILFHVYTEKCTFAYIISCMYKKEGKKVSVLLSFSVC